MDRPLRLEESPALRCADCRELWQTLLPERTAVYQRVDPATGTTHFLCRFHARRDDALIPHGKLITVVSLSAVFTVAGSSTDRALCIAEAVERLETAAGLVGARVSQMVSTASQARYYPSAGAVGRAGEPSEG